jgi:hypothetical protein
LNDDTTDREGPLVRAALASAKLPTKVAFTARAVINGVWLGVLSDDHLRALDEAHYRRVAMYTAPDWNERGLFDWERDLVTEHVPAGARIAVLAAGGGREVLALRNIGYEAVGFESHPELAASARAFLAHRGFSDAAHHVPRDSFPRDAGDFAAVIVGWGAYSLIHGRDRRVQLLSQIRGHIDPGAPVLVSYFRRQDDYREARLTRRLANGLRKVTRRPGIELGDTLSPNLVHVFTDSEIIDEARAAGFDVKTSQVTKIDEVHVTQAAALLIARA